MENLQISDGWRWHYLEVAFYCFQQQIYSFKLFFVFFHYINLNSIVFNLKILINQNLDQLDMPKFNINSIFNFLFLFRVRCALVLNKVYMSTGLIERLPLQEAASSD